MARVLVPTGLFEYSAGIALRLMRGDITTAIGPRHQRPIWKKHRRGEAHEDQAHQRRATP
jgi:hypothetical protein